MGSGMQNALATLLIIGASITVFVLLIVFVAVPLFRGIGTVIGATFRGIGWFLSHIFEFIGGILSDIIRFIGSLLAMCVLIPLVPLNIVIGRWSAAGHFAQGVKRECQVGAACVYRAVIRRPLRLLLLDGLLEGLEQRVPEAMHGAPGADAPSRRTGQFDGYTILGSLRAGGSGAKLYVAEPTPERQARSRGHKMPDRVVIKSFALTEGSSLPQIVRESRALECAKQLGHVLDHGMDEHRFYYVMPYHAGDHLGILTRQMHGECGGRGLDQKRLNHVMSYVHDLLATLSAYHKGGLWHKDVKPENVIVHDGQAHLVDLGLVTPLRSAMTLTTHGTEYFRDPEMVRQALRGVKVHQVDGAKFDIYAAGAVLYFMIENTFPAHGGLSRFASHSPEALRWIVRRAMTEYHQRYATANEMLADLDYVARSSDAFAVKPVDLPSMRGGAAVNQPVPMESVEVVAAAAGSPAPPREAASGQGFAPLPAVAGSNAAAGRPRLMVTNWWTGEYRPDAAVNAAGQGSAPSHTEQARTFRQHAFAFRQQAEQISRQARAGAMSARKAAREQIRAARQRAREIRGRATAHRHRVTARDPASAWAVAIGVLSVLFLAAILALAFLTSSSLHRGVRLVGAAAEGTPGRPVLLVVDTDEPLSNSIRKEVDRIIANYRKQGYDVITDLPGSASNLAALLRDWRANSDGPADKAIEDALESCNVYGAVHVTVPKSKRTGKLQTPKEMLVRSTRPGSEDRRRLSAPQVPPPPPDGSPFLLINDHPAKADLAVAAEIERRLKMFRDGGWSIVSDDDVEVKVRNVLPVGPIDLNGPLSPMLQSVLTEAKLGGILRIEGKAGEGPVAQRVNVTCISGEALPNPQAPGLSDEPPGPAADANLQPMATTARSG